MQQLPESEKVDPMKEIFLPKMDNSSRRVSRSGWGGGLRSLCIKIGYSEPTRSESREGTSTIRESSRVT